MILIVDSPSLAEISQSSTDGSNIEDEHYIKAPVSGMKTRGKKLRLKSSLCTQILHGYGNKSVATILSAHLMTN